MGDEGGDMANMDQSELIASTAAGQVSLTDNS